MSIEKEVAFDPYHKWLGIPKAQRPPTHYQLLGLAQGEADGEVIEEAAIRQTTHLRTYQVGPHADDCTRMLNEISMARQVLANPQKRQEYDGKLAQLAAKRSALQPGNGNAKPAQAAPIVESAFADLSGDDDVPAGGSRRDLAKSIRAGKPTKRPAPQEQAKGFSQTMILAAAGSAGFLVVGLVAIVAFLVSPPPPPAPPAPLPANANNNPKVGPGVANPLKQPGGDVKVPADANPKNPKDPLAGVTGFPPLGAFTLRFTPKNLVAMADGRVFYGDTTSLQVYDPGSSRDLRPIAFTETGPRGLRFALAPDSKLLYVGLPDVAKLTVVKLYGAQVGLLKSAGEVSAMAISPDGSTLVTGTFGGHVHIWNLATYEGVDMPQFHGPRPVELVVFSKDGSMIATASEKRIMLWSARETKIIGATDVPGLTSMAFAPDGQKLLVASPAGLQTITLNGSTSSTVKAGRPGILRVAFVNDTTLAALRPEGPELYEWPTMTLLRQNLIGTRDCDTMALSPDGKALFVGLTSPRLLAFGTESDVVLKPYGSSTERPVVMPPPTGSNSYVGNWHFPTNPTGLVKIDVTVKSVAGVLSAQIEIRRSTLPVGKAHVDALKNVNGKMQGGVIADTAIPVPWTGLSDLVLDAPFNETMRIELRGTRSHFYPMQRIEGGIVESPPPKMPVPPKTDPIPVARVNVPPPEKIAEVTAIVHETYKAEYAKKRQEDRTEFAETLLKLALESKNDAADRYVLFCEARDVAASAGKWSIVADAFEQLEAGFIVDLLPQKEAALQLLLKGGLNKESAIEATEAALQGFGEAVAADQLPLAGSFLAIAGTASSKAQSVPHSSLFRKADAEFKLITQEAEIVKKARETLKTMPADPAANLAVGRYEALRRNEWQPALPLLAKGSDADLAAIAKKDLESPKDGAAQQKVAEEWLALAEKEKDSTWIRAALQSRAAHWYHLAASQLSGLTLMAVNGRLKTIEEAPSPFRIGGATAELKTMRGHKGEVTSLHLTPDGKRLFSGSLDATVRSWDLKLAKALTSFPAGQPIQALSFNPSMSYLALGFKDTMKVVDVLNPNNPKRLPSGNAWPASVWIDENTIYSVYAGGFSTSNITFGTGGAGPHLMRGSGWVSSPTHQWMVVYGEETWICQTPGGGLAGRFKLTHADNVTSTIAAFSPTQQVFAVATSDKKIHLMEIVSRNVTATIEGGSGVARCLVYVPAGDRLLSGGDDGVVHIWDVSTGKETRHFSTGSKGVTALIVTPDGKQIITGGNDGVIRVWAMPRERAAPKTAAMTSGKN